jgi:hypothetical protein
VGVLLDKKTDPKIHHNNDADEDEDELLGIVSSFVACSPLAFLIFFV